MDTTTQPLASIGIDIGKEVFHIVGFSTDGKIVLRRKIKRLALTETFKKLPPCVVGMEACLSAHFVSRALRQLGHEPRIIPAIYVKPFVKGQKNDYNDAEAIAEAALRPNLRVVREKTQDQLDLQALHRVRSRLVSRRTATINQIRAFLIEQGIAVRVGARALRNSLPAILKNRQDEISPRMRGLIVGLYDDWIYLDERIETIAGEIEKIGETEANCRRLMSVPGIGPLISTAVVAAIGTGEAFERGRDFGAWLGLVPRQYSTGGRSILGRISKRQLVAMKPWSCVQKPCSEAKALPWLTSISRYSRARGERASEPPAFKSYGVTKPKTARSPPLGSLANLNFSLLARARGAGQRAAGI